MTKNTIIAISFVSPIEIIYYTFNPLGAQFGEILVRVQAFSVSSTDRSVLRGRGSALRSLVTGSQVTVGRGFAGKFNYCCFFKLFFIFTFLRFRPQKEKNRTLIRSFCCPYVWVSVRRYQVSNIHIGTSLWALAKLGFLINSIIR